MADGSLTSLTAGFKDDFLMDFILVPGHARKQLKPVNASISFF